jgi:hypothetical protein
MLARAVQRSARTLPLHAFTFEKLEALLLALGFVGVGEAWWCSTQWFQQSCQPCEPYQVHVYRL